MPRNPELTALQFYCVGELDKPAVMDVRKIDLTGLRFGSLVAIREAGRDGNGNVKWLCQCDCGKTSLPTATALRSGNSTSCGCRRKRNSAAALTKHGSRRSPEYRVWSAMKTRCYNPKASNYAYYGGRGISVCDRWRRSFAAFLADMGPRPSSNHTIERKENAIGYEPGNCEWAERCEQSRNRRNVVLSPEVAESFRAVRSAGAGVKAEAIRLGINPSTAQHAAIGRTWRD